MFKQFIQKKLESYVKQYFQKHPEVKLVAITGSVGKTSTKIAIATILSEKYRVRLHEGNHNSELSAPVAILGLDYPTDIKNFGQWVNVFRAAKERINEPTDVDVIIQELGSDRIGQIPAFGRYIKPDIGVVTAVASEHMEYFMSLENVAQEELALANFSKRALINKDDIAGEFSKYLTNPNINTYGTSATAEYHFLSENYDIQSGHDGKYIIPGLAEPFQAQIYAIGEHTLRPAIAAAAVGSILGMNSDEIKNGLSKVRSVPGRMSLLHGVSNSVLIDDTYNSSPLAAQSSLRVLYQITAPQKIVVFGDMNELGNMTEIEHVTLGDMCDPNQLAWVVTVGVNAEKYLAPAARARGCQVKSFMNALLAGAFVRGLIEEDTAVLFKGSQGDIYLEEAVKVCLHTSDDEEKLVRQSPEWMAKKEEFFRQNS